MVTTMMSSVDKALALLRHFTVQNPELGLSELARIAGYDKTTTLRCMTALQRNDFVEQDIHSRKYRLGLAPISLAQIREQSFPVQAVLKRHLDLLCQDIGETAHATLVIGDDFMTAGISEPDRALRVHVDPSGALPLHATASGIAIAAFMPPEVQIAMIARQKFEKYTGETPETADQVHKQLTQTRASGIGRAFQTYEIDVVGTAAPIFNASRVPIGAIAIAAVSMRLTPALQKQIDDKLIASADMITRELGGMKPAKTPEGEETPK